MARMSSCSSSFDPRPGGRIAQRIEVEFQVQRTHVGNSIQLAADERDEITDASFGRDVRALDGGPEGCHLSGVGVLEESEEEVLFVLEVRVDRPLGVAGGGGHLIEGRFMESSLRKDLGRRLKQVLTGLLAPAFCGEGFEWHRALCYAQV